MLPVPWWWRGFQSAIFYYVSCAPCAEARYRKKRKRDAVRDRADRDLLEQEMGGQLYRHPSPSSTNPHWLPEIGLGPTMTARGRKKTNTNKTESRRGRSDPTPVHMNASGSDIASSVDLPRKVIDNRGDGNANYNQYQREDDELWGSTATDPPLRVYLDGSSAHSMPRRPDTARTKDSSSSYHSYCNPPVSDLHPPIAPTIHSREDVAWMLQPPPTADVMSGKRRPPRSRSDSGGSRPTASSVSLSRQMSNRIIEKRMRTGDSLRPASSRNTSGDSSDAPQGQRHDRINENSSTDRIDFADSPSKREKRRPSPLLLKPESSEESAVTVVRNRNLAPLAIRKPRRTASRPNLSTIMSDSTVPAPAHETEFYTPAQTPKENSLPDIKAGDDSSGDYDMTARRSGLVAKDDTFSVVHNSKIQSPMMFNTKIFAASPARLQSKVLLAPGQDGCDDTETRRSSAIDGLIGDERFDSWYSPEFEQWVHEHTKREVRQRWSMDF